MSQLKVEVLFPMAPDIPSSELYNYPIEEKYKSIDELRQLCHNTLFDLDSYLETSFKVEIKNNIPDEYYWHFIDHGFIGKYLSTYNQQFLELSFITDFDFSKVKMYDGSTGEEELEVPDSFVYSVISSAVKEKVFQLLVVSQIAKPGGLHLRQGVIIINNEKSTDINGTLLIREAVSYSKKIIYPKFSFLSFQEVYNWFVNNDLLLTVEPTSKLQIALNAFTFLFDNNLSSEIELIYTCMALEALYTKGNTNITEQLNDKIQVYLGQVSDYKKSIKNMYDFRSRFLHGSLPIKPIDCDTSIWTVHERGIGEATNLSKMILIATFQKMFLDNKTSLEFEYQLK